MGVGAPTPAQPLVVVGTEQGQVVGLSAGDGSVRWRTAVGGPVRSSAASDGGGAVWLTSVGKEGLVPVAGSLSALDAATGGLRWTVDCGPSVTSPALSADGA